MPGDDPHEYQRVTDTTEDARMAEGLCVRLQIGEGEFNSHSGLVKREDREDVMMVVQNLHQGGPD